MRKQLLGTLAVLALAGPAMAADLPVKAPVYKAQVVDPWAWTGFYVGLNAGSSWGKSATDITYFNNVTGLPIAPPPGSVTQADIKLNGGIAGGQIGYNWQLSPQWLLGLEADIQWSGQKGSAAFSCAVAA